MQHKSITEKQTGYFSLKTDKKPVLAEAACLPAMLFQKVSPFTPARTTQSLSIVIQTVIYCVFAGTTA